MKLCTSLLFASICLALASQKTLGNPLQSASPQALYESGVGRLSQGDPWQASVFLDDALSKYRAASDSKGILQTRIAQSELQHLLGSNLQACRILLSALELNEVEVCAPNPTQTTQNIFDAFLQTVAPGRLSNKALLNLSFYLSAIGNLEMSRRVVSRLSETRVDSDLEQLVALGKANLERLFFIRNRNRAAIDNNFAVQRKLQRESALHAQAALSVYEKLANSSNPSIRLKSALSWLELYSAVRSWSLSVRDSSPLVDLQKRTEPVYSRLSNFLSRSDFRDLPITEAIYGRLRWVQLQFDDWNPSSSLQSHYALVKDSLQEARTLKNIRGQSFALGLLGQIYQRNNQSTEAQKFFLSAISHAQSINAWDSAYRWQWMMARSLVKGGKWDDALNYYRLSVQSLEQVRSDLLAIDSELQFSFVTDITPVYREYIELLLASDDVESIEPALAVYNQLQTAELENYLRCGRLSSISIATIKDAPPTIYILDLGDRYEVVLRNPDGTYIRHQPETEVVRANLTDIHNYIDTIQTSRFNSIVTASFYVSSNKLYRQLIEPLEQHLPTGVAVNFVLDTTLQNIPMALLNRGQEFLIGAYAPVTILKDQILPPQKLAPNSLNILIAGLSNQSPSMESRADLQPLPEVQIEAVQIASLANKSKTLLNEQFTRQAFDQFLGRYPIVHVASHGEFSSDPSRNVVYAWDSTLSGPYLQGALDRQDLSRNSIELLVLSACQTAKGDPQSSLGLAGLSVRAGARSTVASLWKVDSGATVLMMTLFYDGLQEGLPKAEALRQAQLGVKRQQKYAHPYYWAGFILVGSWL